jgi:formylmethanofuran dehydrogenase subunit C
MLNIELRKSGRLPIEVFGTSPDALDSLSLESLRKRKVYEGNRAVEFGRLFEIDGDPADGQQVWSGDLARVSGIGYRMQSGWIRVDGDAGNYVGARMSNGTILVGGSVGNGLASEITGGLVHVRGNAGDDVGAAMAGTRTGQNGGTILVRGSVGHGAGRLMRRGMIAIEGNAGNCCGFLMRGGTIYAGGRFGKNAGAEMVRGTLIVNEAPEPIPPGFVAGGTLRMPVTRLVDAYLRENGFPDPQLSGREFCLFHGDGLHGGRGELLIIAKNV